jgi:hypothetical protein
MSRLLIATAVIEVGAGLFLLVAPLEFARLLFGVSLDNAATLTVARIAGAGLFTLGVAAWFATIDAASNAARGFIRAMVLYNCAAAIILAAATFQPASHSKVLWSGVAIHGSMAAWCIAQLLKK